MPLRARRAERARHAPSALNLTFKVYFLSFASGCQRAFPEGMPLGNPAAQYKRNTGLACARTARRPLQKEVIQPLVPQRLPCYDFIPVTGPTFVDCPPRGSARRLRVWSAPMM